MGFKEARDIWGVVLGILEVEVSRSNFKTWLKDTEGLEYRDGLFVVGVPNTFVWEWLEGRLLSLIEKTLFRVLGREVEVVFSLKSPPQPSPELNPRYTFENFIVGSSNQFAYNAALEAVSNPGCYNPVFIYGGSALGKTHLLQAIAHSIAKKRSCLYITAEAFTDEFISCLQENRMKEFKRKLYSLHFLLIDDFHFFGGKKQTQEYLLQTFAHLLDCNCQIVVSSFYPPQEIPSLLPPLRSRLLGGLIAPIYPPDLQTKILFLRAKAKEQKIEISQKALELIAQKAENLRELEGRFNQALAWAKMKGMPIDEELAIQVLNGKEGGSSSIIRAVAKYLHLSPEAILSKKREQKINLARKLVIYLLREEMSLPFSQIAGELGLAKSSVLYAYKEISQSHQLLEHISKIKEGITR